MRTEGRNFLGGLGACSPGKFLKLDSLKRHFLRSPGPDFITYDRNDNSFPIIV